MKFPVMLFMFTNAILNIYTDLYSSDAIEAWDVTHFYVCCHFANNAVNY